MHLAKPLVTKRLVLRELTLEDVTEKYVTWLNDPDVNRFLESRFTKHTPESVRRYVETMNASDGDLLFGMFLDEDARHIGNIRLGPVDPSHKHGAIGLLIGEKNYWGKGYASEAIDAVANFALGPLTLHKVFAGYYAGNLGSRQAFRKAGFHEEACLHEQWFCDGKWQDGFLACRMSEKIA